MHLHKIFTLFVFDTVQESIYNIYKTSFSPEVEVKVTLRLTVSRPICPGVRRPSGTCDQFYFLLEIFFRQLRFCTFVAPSLTRGGVCNLLVQLLQLQLQLQLNYDQQSVGQSVLVSGAHLEPVTNYSFSLKFPLDICGFVIL
jgi:hypothetical protein